MNPVKIWVCFEIGRVSTEGPVCVQGTRHPDCGSRNVWKSRVHRQQGITR